MAMGIDGPGADVQQGTDLLGAHAFGQKLQYFRFPVAEAGRFGWLGRTPVHIPFNNRFSDFRAEIGPPAAAMLMACNSSSTSHVFSRYAEAPALSILST